MNPRTTAMLALVALVLGAFVYFYEIEGEKGREAGLESEKRLFTGVEADAVESLELTTNDGVPARFERRDGIWRIVSPVEGAGDAVALDAIASALAQLARAGRVKAAPGDLAQFGLGDHAQIVRFDAKSTRHTLRIGKATPVGGNVYVMTSVAKEVTAEAGSEVAYVESFRLNAWKKNLDDLRDRRILALEADEVERLEIAWPEAGGTFELALARDAERNWQIEKPIAARADQATVNELLSNLAYLQASGFVDERTPAVEEALRETAISFRWSMAGGDKKGEATGDAASQAPRAFRIAGLLDGARVVEGEGGGLHRIAAERLDDFGRRLAAYRDKQLSELDLASLARIELEFAAKGPGEGAQVAAMTPVAPPDEVDARRIVLVQKEGTWSSEGRDLDPEALAGLAANLVSLRASDLVADEMGEAELASLGLAPPALRIRLISGSGDTAETAALELELGRLDPERGLFARRSPDTAVFVLPASLAESLPLSLAEFEARLVTKAPEPIPDFPSAEGSASDSEENAASDLLEQ